jgi:hypothetical protein
MNTKNAQICFIKDRKIYVDKIGNFDEFRLHRVSSFFLYFFFFFLQQHYSKTDYFI